MQKDICRADKDLNLAIDIGNSRLKAGVLSDGEVEESVLVQLADWQCALQYLMDRFHPRRAMICAVVEMPVGLLAMLENAGIKVYLLGATTPLPFHNDYRTPQTLGTDRMAAVAGAVMRWRGQNVLVVDAGSCVTYDVVRADGHYVGGNIAPGIKMRLKSMHEHTQRLPLVEKEGEAPIIGHDTETAMRTGALRGVGWEVMGLRRELQAMGLRPLRTVLTGGDARLIKEQCGLEEVEEDDFLVLRGLDYILRYNGQDD